MKDNKIGLFIIIIVGVWVGGLLIGISTKKDAPQIIIDTSKTDSMQVFYSKQLDSIKVENQLLQVKIEAKTETIRTLKGLVKENNEKINPNNSVPILDSLRRSGFGKD